MRPLVERIASTAAPTEAASSRSTACQCTVPPAACTPVSARSAASWRSTSMTCRSITTGVGFSPRALASAINASFSRSRPARRRATCGSSAAGGATRSSRWNVPPLAAARSATIALVIPPAAPVTAKTLSRSRRMDVRRRDRPDVEADRPARPGAPADLEGSRIGERLGHQRVCDLGVGGAAREVDDLHERVVPLAPVGLDEPLDGAAERRVGAVVAEAEEPAQTRRGHEEGAAGSDALVQDAHRRREVLDDDPGPLAEGVDGELVEASFRVERREPEDAVDGTVGEPAAQGRLDGRGGLAHVDRERGRAELRQLLLEDALARAAGDDDARPRAEPDAGRLAQLERRAQDGRSDAPRHPVRAGERKGLRRARRWRRRCSGRRRRRGNGGRRGSRGRRRGEVGPMGVDEADDVAQRREVAQAQALDARDRPLLADGGEGLGLLHGIDAEVGLEVQVHVEQVGRVAGLLGDDGDDALGDRVGAAGGRSRRRGRGRGYGGGCRRRSGQDGCRWRSNHCGRGGWRCGEIGPMGVDEADDVAQRREVAQAQALDCAGSTTARGRRRRSRPASRYRRRGRPRGPGPCRACRAGSRSSRRRWR